MTLRIILLSQATHNITIFLLISSKIISLLDDNEHLFGYHFSFLNLIKKPINCKVLGQLALSSSKAEEVVERI